MRRRRMGRMRSSTPAGPSLFSAPPDSIPLAERMRPRNLDEVVGQAQVLGPESPLRRALQEGRPYSMILWGPPGCGKTTLARLAAHAGQHRYVALSAVLSGLPEVRKVLDEAARHHSAGQRTVLFVDEVHRFRGSGLLSNWQKPVCMQRLNLDAA